MITKLKLKNWTSHKNSEMEFSNSNIFLGVIGSGKSSVVEAITFALFGSFPALISRELNLADVIRFGEDKAYVEVEMVHNGKNVRIIRTIERIRKKARTTAKLFINSRLISESPSEVNSYLESLFEIDLATFSNTLYASQNKLEAIAELSPSERRKLVDELINIEKLERAHKNSISLINKVQRIIKFFSEQVTEMDITSSISNSERIGEEIKKLNEESNNSKKELEKISSILSTKESYYSTLLDKRRRKESLLQHKSKLLGVIEELKEYENVKIEEIENLKDSLSLIKKEILNLDSAINEKKKENKALIAHISSLKKEISIEEERRETESKLESMLTSLNKQSLLLEIDESKRRLEAIKQRMAEKKSFLIQAKKSLKELENATSACPVCLKPLTEEDKKGVHLHWINEINNSNKEIDELEKELSKITSLVKKKEESLEKIRLIESKLSYLKERGKDLDKMNLELKRLDSLLKENEKLLSSLNLKKDEMVKREHFLLNKIKEGEENIRKKRKLEESKRMLDELNVKISSIKFDEGELEALRNEINEMTKKKQKILSFLNEASSLIREKMRLKKEIDKNIEIYNKTKKKLEKSKKALEDLSVAKSVIEQVQKEARKNLLDSINLALNTIWKIVYPYRDYVSLKVSAENNSYSFLIYDGFEWKELERVASGGEKTIFVLALRLAIASVLMGKLDFIILDEPTHNLDDNAVEKLAEAITEEFPSLTNQFFIITHDERLKNVEHGKVFYFDRKKEDMSPTEVKEI